MLVYHASSTLPVKTIPKGSPYNGVFVTPQKEFSQIFGSTIHVFEIDESTILNLKNESHLLKAKKHPLFHTIEIHESTGLPFAFNHVTTNESLENMRQMAKELGFSSAWFYETAHAQSIEVWDTTTLIFVSSEDNDRFDELSE